MSQRDRIDAILNSVEGIERAQPKSFFTGRVLSSINSKKPEENFSFTPLLRVVIVAVVMLVAVNILLFINKYQVEPKQPLAEWKNTTPDWILDYTENPGSSLSQVPNE